MEKLKGNALVGQSGGPTAAINSSLAGVYMGALESECIETVYGMRNGMQGFLEERMVDLGSVLKNEDQLELLRRTPASFLGSCRYKLPDPAKDSAVFEKAFALFEKYQIKYFFYIGGNDSMDTVMKLTRYGRQIGSDVRFVGVPKTIDNDLVATDHTPGYGSAAKYIASTVREITRDAQVYDLHSVSIIEIMGRNAGWLTAASALARTEAGDSPDLIYLPERDFSFDQFVSDVAEAAKRKKNIVVTISEGAHTADGAYVCESVASGTADAFGHKYLSGTARVLEDVVRDKLGFKARGIELNIPQRCASHLSSQTDLDESFAIGEGAVYHAVDGASGVMMAYRRLSDDPYEIVFEALDIDQIANAEKTIPDEWINEAGNDVTQAFIDYALPLIQGEVFCRYENGLPKHLKL